MNKRQKKKKQKRDELFIDTFCSSYREVRSIYRFWHEHFLQCKRREKAHGVNHTESDF